MGKQISIVVPDEVYGELVELSKGSMRPVATEAVYQMRRGMMLSEVREVPEGRVVTTGANPMYGKDKSLVDKEVVKFGDYTVAQRDKDREVFTYTASFDELLLKTAGIEPSEREEWLKKHPGKKLSFDGKSGTYFLKD